MVKSKGKVKQWQWCVQNKRTVCKQYSTVPVLEHILPISKMAHKERGEKIWRTRYRNTNTEQHLLQYMTSRRGWYSVYLLENIQTTKKGQKGPTVR